MEKDDILLLQKAGFTPNKAGGVLLCRDAKLIYEALQKLIKIKFNKFYSQSVYAPNLIDSTILKKAKYDAHFPQNILNVFSHKKGSFEVSIPPAAFFMYSVHLKISRYLKEIQDTWFLVAVECLKITR